MGCIQSFSVSSFKSTFDLRNFVETGAFHGDAIAHCLPAGFDNYMSCEIEAGLHQGCVARFVPYKNVLIYHGKSVDFIKEHVVGLEGNCLFWLDAHFPGADAHIRPYNAEPCMTTRLPLEDELHALSPRFKTHRDVFIIDDRWLYENDPTIASGSIGNHMIRHGFARDEAGVRDILGNPDPGLVEMLLGTTHIITRFSHDNGYYVAAPRSANR